MLRLHKCSFSPCIVLRCHLITLTSSKPKHALPICWKTRKTQARFIWETTAFLSVWHLISDRQNDDNLLTAQDTDENDGLSCSGWDAVVCAAATTTLAASARNVYLPFCDARKARLLRREVLRQSCGGLAALAEFRGGWGERWVIALGLPDEGVESATPTELSLPQWQLFVPCASRDQELNCELSWTVGLCIDIQF